MFIFLCFLFLHRSQEDLSHHLPILTESILAGFKEHPDLSQFALLIFRPRHRASGSTRQGRLGEEWPDGDLAEQEPNSSNALRNEQIMEAEFTTY